MSGTRVATDNPNSLNQSTSPQAFHPICNPKDGPISSANLVGLVDHVLQTDDKHFKQILLQTYRDYTTPEELFEVLIQRFLEVPQEMAPEKTTRAILFFLPSVPPTSHLLYEIRDCDSDRKQPPSDHRDLIRKGIESRLHGPVPRNYGTVAEPDNPYQIAVALTLMEAELRQTVRWIDYCLHDRGLPSHIDDLVSANIKMTCWLKSSILYCKEIKGRAKAIKQFVKIAEVAHFVNYFELSAITISLRLVLNYTTTTRRLLSVVF
ncbi:ras guanine nucleotide exchange factor domain-containing protein [Mycena olivaceomarginata]|nr:ras guanine nucleotide exchange factor domain-containing protein [Mycena olivaceomarginata]